MEKIALEIVGLTTGHAQKGSYTLILGEIDGSMKLPVVIGGFEAQAIALEIEKIKPQRPMTHDLFRNFAVDFGIEVSEIRIDHLLEGVFYAKIICEKGGEQKEIDARTSDAIALAVRFQCPIYTYRNILDQAGVELTDEDTDIPERAEIEDEFLEDIMEEESIEQMDMTELERLLEEAIQVEDYDKAAVIRDEINRRRRS